MYGRKNVDLDRVLAQDGEFLIAIIEHRATYNPWISLESLLLESALDSNLPQTHRAENKFGLARLKK